MNLEAPGAAKASIISTRRDQTALPSPPTVIPSKPLEA